MVPSEAGGDTRRDGRLPHIRALATEEFLQLPARRVCARRARRLPARTGPPAARGARPGVEYGRRQAAPARAEVIQLSARYGIEALVNPEAKRRSRSAPLHNPPA